MAPLALIASHTVNGVARTHTELLKSSVFKVTFLLVVMCNSVMY